MLLGLLLQRLSESESAFSLWLFESEGEDAEEVEEKDEEDEGVDDQDNQEGAKQRKGTQDSRRSRHGEARTSGPSPKRGSKRHDDEGETGGGQPAGARACAAVDPR